MLVAIATFAVLVALWGSPVVHATLRGWARRLVDRLDRGRSGEPDDGSAARLRVERAPSGPRQA
jgi:hypothetical protein